MVPVEVTLGTSWEPDCTPAFSAPVLGKGSQPRLTAWPPLYPRPSIITPPVVVAGLTEDNKDAVVVEATEGYPSLIARRTGQAGVQPLIEEKIARCRQ